MRFIAFIMLCVLTVPSTTFAQETSDREQARALYEQGASAYERHRWLECAQSFERSFTIVFAPELLYNIGRCYGEAARISRNREHYRRAIAGYQRYMMETGEGGEELVLEIDRLRGEMELLPEEQVEEPEPEVIVPPPAEVPVPTPVVVEEEPEVLVVPPTSEPYAWTATTVLAGTTVATTIAALVVGALADEEYSSLTEGCGSTPEGCTPNQINRLNNLTDAANALFVASGVLLAGSGVSFAIEFANQAQGNPAPSAFGVSYTGSF